MAVDPDGPVKDRRARTRFARQLRTKNDQSGTVVIDRDVRRATSLRGYPLREVFPLVGRIRLAVEFANDLCGACHDLHVLQPLPRLAVPPRFETGLLANLLAKKIGETPRVELKSDGNSDAYIHAHGAPYAITKRIYASQFAIGSADEPRVSGVRRRTTRR